MGWKVFCEFEVLGLPKGQPRVRAFVRGKRAGVYDPGTANDWKSCVAIDARKHLPSVPLDQAVCLSCTFFFPRPKRLMTKSSPDGPILHTAKPDTDNSMKAVMDALTEIGMWRDDAQVASIQSTKYYAAKDQRTGAEIQVLTYEEA